MKAKRAAADEKNCAACVRPFIDLKRALLSLEFLFLPSSLVAPCQSSFQCPSMSFSYFCTPYVAPEGGERTCLVARPRSEAQDRPSPVRDRPAGRPPPLTRPPLASATAVPKRYTVSLYDLLGTQSRRYARHCPRFVPSPFFFK